MLTLLDICRASHHMLSVPSLYFKLLLLRGINAVWFKPDLMNEFPFRLQQLNVVVNI